MFPMIQLIPFIPTNNMKPPTLYALLNSIVNNEAEEKTPIKKLANIGHSKIFDFDYPLTDKVDKDKFEIMILNHFLMRRIGYATFTAWQIALNVKMNEIMPYFNVLLNAIDGWDLFKDGENVTRTQTDSRNIKTDYTSDSTGTVNVSDSTTQDLRYSNLPENQLEDVQNGSYVTEYNYNTTEGNNQTNTNNVQDDKTTVNDSGNVNETISRSPADKINILKTFINETNSVYSMIFKELDSLFYGLE